MHVLRVDERLVETAEARSTAERQMAVSAEQLFATLEDGPSYSKWVPVIREVTWTSPMPFTIGTTRTVMLVGGIRTDEAFWAWEPNRRMGFSITASSRRWVNALSELYEITPLSSERCKLRWTMAMSLPGVLSRIDPYIGRAISIGQARMLKALERVAREHSSRA
ncbi:SRPBCC family protein [Mycobacterium sp.]|uniref:SRPBCC family protein n=1 Tax=Mycobacterium sp. TaxID=1785 RepID=UPI002D915466|nr:SRPBCC family protein [Mycobacterium sp.]